MGIRVEPPTRTIYWLFQGPAFVGTQEITHVIDLFLLDFRVLEYLLDGFHRLSEEIHVQLLELRPCERL